MMNQSKRKFLAGGLVGLLLVAATIDIAHGDGLFQRIRENMQQRQDNRQLMRTGGSYSKTTVVDRSYSLPAFMQSEVCVDGNCLSPAAASPSDVGFSLASFSPEPQSFNADIPVTVLESKQRFRRSLLRAAAEARKQGKITARESIRIRVASFSPAFLQHAEDLAVIQMAFSGENDSDIPRDAEGKIQRQSINWEGLTQFLQALLPLILAIIEALGA